MNVESIENTVKNIIRANNKGVGATDRLLEKVNLSKGQLVFRCFNDKVIPITTELLAAKGIALIYNEFSKLKDDEAKALFLKAISADCMNNFQYQYNPASGVIVEEEETTNESKRPENYLDILDDIDKETVGKSGIPLYLIVEKQLESFLKPDEKKILNALLKTAQDAFDHAEKMKELYNRYSSLVEKYFSISVKVTGEKDNKILFKSSPVQAPVMLRAKKLIESDTRGFSLTNDPRTNVVELANDILYVVELSLDLTIFQANDKTVELSEQ